VLLGELEKRGPVIIGGITVFNWEVYRGGRTAGLAGTGDTARGKEYRKCRPSSMDGEWWTAWEEMSWNVRWGKMNTTEDS